MRRTLKQHIDANRRASVIYSALLVGLLMALGTAVVGAYAPDLWPVGALGSGLLGLTVGLIAHYSGSAIALRLAHAEPATPLQMQILRNVTEEMAIAAGIPMPQIYVIPSRALNAFATGRDPRNAAIAVTSGLLETLDRDELQGVIAHEIAHIRNYDVRLMTTLAIVAGLIPMIAEIFLRSLWHTGGHRGSRSSSGGNAGQLIFFLIGLVLAIVAPLFAKLLELAVSRQREYLADATAAELTRYPEGLASALAKIARSPARLESANPAINHMFIVNPLRPFEKRVHSLFATHPPIEDRIRRLRALMGNYPEARARAEHERLT